MEFGPTIKSFSENLSALRDFVLQVGSVLEERERDVIRKHRDDLAPFLFVFGALDPGFEIPEVVTKQLSDKVEVVKKDGEKQACTLTIRDVELGNRFATAFKAVNLRKTQQSLLYSSSLISLISAAEWFLSRLFHGFFETYPDTAKTQEKVFSLKDLKTFNSIADAQRHLIEMRVDEIMWGSLDGWVTVLKTKMGLSMGYLTPYLEEVTEIFQRRNVVVHNNGSVHSSYIAKVVAELRKDVSVGDMLRVSPDYLTRAIDVIELEFMLIAAELWKKLAPTDAKRGDVLIEQAFSSLVAERWWVAEGISNFLMLDKGLPERDQLVGQLNYWQSLKWQGRFEEVKLDVEKADFSAKDELFKLGHIALLSEEAQFFELLPSVIGAGKLTYASLRDWPIFREMRKTEEFQRFCEKHQKDFDPTEQDGAST